MHVASSSESVYPPNCFHTLITRAAKLRDSTMSSDWFLIANSASASASSSAVRHPPVAASTEVAPQADVSAVNQLASQLEAAASMRQQLARSAFRRINTGKRQLWSGFAGFVTCVCVCICRLGQLASMGIGCM